ncbi:MAG: glycosyltransferase family 39 protein [Candidatus Heimdallarchaeota archaeon]|nr:MAG: glycosyltransferase family 39 protein [Candidatus Heimdallarchaeota archaeon]
MSHTKKEEMQDENDKPTDVTINKLYTEPEKSITEKIIFGIWSIIVKFRFIVVIALLAFLVKVTFIHSIDMWDEGWFSAIASRMAFGLNPSDPFLPLYYPSEGDVIKFFDKPPASFWFGALLMVIFGRTTFAAKGIVILGGTGLAVIVYLLFSHQTENKSASVIAGLLVALAHFITFYSRTAYIDSFVVFMGALVLLLAIRAIDAIFVENNLLKGYFLLAITLIVNILNILTKAWQGILIFPSIAIYLVIRFIERHINLDDLQTIWQEITTRFTMSPKDMESSLFIQSDTIGNEVPFPFVVATVAGVCAFIGAYFINQLIVSSILLAIISAFGCYIVFLRYCIGHKSQLRLPGFVTGITGIFAGISGSLIIKIFYSRLADSFTSLAQALGEEDVFASGVFSGLLTSSSGEAFSNVDLALLVLELIVFIFGAIVAFGVIFFLAGVILDLFTDESNFLKVIYEGFDLIPIVILGIWFGLWFVVFLLMGEGFNRDAYSITVVGVAVSLLLLPIIIFYPALKNFITKQFNLGTRLRSPEESSAFQSHLLFLGFFIIVLIVSFYPFVYWVQYLDANIANGTFPWGIRVPGELAGDPERPNPVTYTFLFFEYYIAWRYTHATAAGDLPGSLGSAISDYSLVVMLPFFIVGAIAFFFSNKRNPALGSVFIAWLIAVPFVFFPAQFQLNYYYIPLAVPYFAIAAKGIEYIYSNERWRITVADNIERLLAGGYFYIEIGYSYVLSPFITFGTAPLDFVTGSIDLDIFLIKLDSLALFLFVAAIYLIPFTFLAFRVLKTFPGIITTGFAYKFFISSWFKSGETQGFNKLYSVIFHDLPDSLFTSDYEWILAIVEHGAPILTVIGIILLIFGLYWLKPTVRPQALIILALTLSAMLINVSVLVHVNQIFDLRLQESAMYIKNHGGDYNYSTWVIPEAGVQFAMRYYLGYEIVSAGNTPFTTNTTTGMENYYQSHKNVKFWVVINNSDHFHVPPLAINYSGAYRWLTTNEHLVNVDEIVGLTPWYKMHLFVNRTWIEDQQYDWEKLSG